MSLGAARARLTVAAKSLSQEWRQLDAYWHDARRDDLQRQYIDPLAASLAGAMRALTELDERLTKIRHDCE